MMCTLNQRPIRESCCIVDSTRSVLAPNSASEIHYIIRVQFGYLNWGK